MPSTAIVTGGTGGLGAAVVRRLIDDGWRVVVPWIMEGELDRVTRQEGLELLEADLFEPRDVAKVVETAASELNAPLRGLVNLVGGLAPGRVHEVPLEEFEQQFRLNLRATYLVVRTAIARMLENEPPARGSIVCVGSRRHCSRSAAPRATSPLRRP